MFRPSIAPVLVYATLSWLFAFMGILGIVGILEPKYQCSVYLLYPVVALFSLGGLVIALNLFPGASYLRLTDQGFEVRSLWRSRRYRWSDVDEFGVSKIKFYYRGLPMARQAVGFRLSKNNKLKRPPKWLARASTRVSGYPHALPDTYGLKAQDLAQLLNERKHARADAG